MYYAYKVKFIPCESSDIVALLGVEVRLSSYFLGAYIVYEGAFGVFLLHLRARDALFIFFPSCSVLRICISSSKCIDCLQTLDLSANLKIDIVKGQTRLPSTTQRGTVVRMSTLK